MRVPDDRGVTLTDEQKRQRGRRNLAIALALGALVVMFYVITFYKFAGGSGTLD